MKPIRLGDNGDWVRDRYLRRYARALFLDTAFRSVPQAWQTFWKTVYSAEALQRWQQVWAVTTKVEHGPYYYYSPSPPNVLEAPVEQWATHWGMVSVDPNEIPFVDYAASAMSRWAVEGVAPGQEAPQYKWKWKEMCGSLNRTDPVFGVTLSFQFSFKVFHEAERILEARKRFKQLAFAEFDAQIAALDGKFASLSADLATRRSVVKDSARHFSWLVRVIFGGERPVDISNAPGPVARGRGFDPKVKEGCEPSAVYTALKETAKLIGIRVPSLEPTASKVGGELKKKRQPKKHA